MKRVIALAALLLAASACAQETSNTNTSPNTNATANAAATATPAGVSRADIEAKERQVWEALKAKNWDAFAGLLSDDFTFVTKDGVYDKAKTVENVKKLDLTEYTLSDFKFVKVDDDLTVLVYTLTEKSTFDGKPTSGKPTYNASAWANRGGKWVAVYHQDTEAAPPPAGQPTPGASASPAASPAAAASPSSSPAAAPATATDAEKQVWDAIKRKDSNAFANFIASDAIEVEPNGVFDKAASVKNVMAFDASKFTQSDFKEAKLDADAVLVTYMVTGPGPKGQESERHSTIWSNRGGQWKAFFHQGTPVTK